MLFGALTAIGPLTIDMYLAAFPAVSADLDVSSAMVQLTLTATLAGLALGQLFLGSISDAYGRRRPLIAALVLYVLASLVVAVTSSFALLFAMRFVQGFTAAAGMVLSMAMARDLYTGSVLARLLSRLMLVSGVAPVLAPTIGAGFLALGTWRSMFFALGGFGLALAVLALVRVKETLPESRRAQAGVMPALRSYGVLLRSARYLGIVLTGSVAMGALFTYVSAATFVYQDLYGFSVQTYAILFAVGAVMITGGSQLNASLVGRFHPANILRTAMAGGAFFGAVLIILAASDASKWAFIGMLMPALICMGMVMPNTPTLALYDHPDRAGSAAAFLGAMQFLAGALLAPVTGLFPQDSAVPMAAMMFACFAAGSLVFALIAKPRALVRSMPWH
ncbi:multidrug effflux MFS transporter [Spelaeicoccus albus]|nr:multidrug effflux MFS transporter [Spelaeicoccus albus]